MERSLRQQVRSRILAITGILVLVAAAIIGRLFSLQVTGHKRLSARAAEQLTEEIHFLPKRGIISDRAGRRLAVDVEVDSVYGVPSQVADKRAVVQRLAALTGKDSAHYTLELAKKKPFVWLERRVSPTVSSGITAMGWKGVGFIKENRRFYPQREIGAQVLGVAGMDNQGLSGLELGYDRDLWREAVVVMAEQDAFGRDIMVSGPPMEALHGGDELRLTLDEVIQFVAQEELGRGVESAGAAGGSIVVLDPRSGEVLAMANVPFFNPNEPAACGARGARRDARNDVQLRERQDAVSGRPAP